MKSVKLSNGTFFFCLFFSHLDRKRNSIENLNGDKSKPEPCQTVQQKLSASTEDDGYCSKPSSYVSANHARRISHHLNQMKQS